MREGETTDKSKLPVMLDDEPIHGFFELSYASYLVLPRTVLQSMPAEWQRRFVLMMGEILDMLGEFPGNLGTYRVLLHDQHGRFIKDPLRDYERGRRRLPYLHRPKEQPHELVQLLNPRSHRYVKVDKTAGTIVSHKKSPGPYKGIPIYSKETT